MSKKLMWALMVAALVALPGGAAVAGVSRELKCKDAKVRTAGAHAVAVLKAVSINMRKSNLQKMERALSRSRSVLTKTFGRLESRRMCPGADDAGAIAEHVNVFVSDVISTLTPSGSVPTTTSTTSTLPSSTTSTSSTSTSSTTSMSTTTTSTTTSSTVLMTTTTLAGEGTLVINEADYDQAGSDDGEFVEVFNRGDGPIDLNGMALVLVNGADQGEYARIDLSTGGVLPAGGYLVIAASSVSVPASAVKVELPGTGVIQNGPDGIALVDTLAGLVLDTLSYEGEIRAATVSGFSGTIDLVEGQPCPEADSGTEPGALARIPNGADTDDAAVDWVFTGTPTPGAANT